MLLKVPLSLRKAMLVDRELNAAGHSIEYHLIPMATLFNFTKDHKSIGQVSAKIIEVICRRYGRPLEDSPQASDIQDSLSLGTKAKLQSWHYQAVVDVHPKHYILFQPDTEPALALLTRQFVNSLFYICTSA